MVNAVPRMLAPAALASLAFAMACSNPDNVVLGGVSPGPQTPLVVFDNINSSISGTIMLRDPSGNPLAQSAVVIISDQPDLCSALKANPSYFRQPTKAFEALILFMPPGILGTFVIGRGGDADNATSSEIIATLGAEFTAVTKGVANQGTGSLQLGGAPTQAASKVVIDITGSGEPGAATFQYSLNGGGTFSADQTVPASGAFPLDVTGATVTFAPGTSGTSFVAGDTFSFGVGIAPAPFTVLGGGSYIALTNWGDNPGDEATGSFDLVYQNPTVGGAFEFTGRFLAVNCPGLDGVLLP